jgi:hypothetical protein
MPDFVGIGKAVRGAMAYPGTKVNDACNSTQRHCLTSEKPMMISTLEKNEFLT